MEKIMFEIIDKKTDEFPKFRFSCETVVVKCLTDSEDGLDDCWKKLFKNITCKYDPNDSISINVSTDSVELEPVSEVFKPVSSYDDAEFSNFMRNAVSNYKNFCINDDIKIVVSCLLTSQRALELSVSQTSHKPNDTSEDDQLSYISYEKKYEKSRNSEPDHAFVFYDFETMLENTKENEKHKIHKVNLCVAQQVCDKCNEPGRLDKSIHCNYCGRGNVRIFKENPVESFVNYLWNEKRPTNIEAVTCIAHNSQGFDCQFILKHLIERRPRITPSFIVIKGTEIMYMSIKNPYNIQIRFIDSYNYIKEKLEKFPEIFEFVDDDCVKGKFPFLFNTPEHQNYKGPVPEEKFYSPGTMSAEDLQKFESWHTQLREDGYQFDFQSEIVSYCETDVDILRRGCCDFRQKFIELTDMDPFGLYMPVTLAGFCHKFYIEKILPEVYRKNPAKEKIGLMPDRGYRKRSKNTRESLEWLLIREKETNSEIIHIGRGHEYRLPELDIIVNGFSKSENGKETVYRYYDCTRHGCPECRVPSQMNNYEKIVKMSSKIRNFGYRLEEMWSCRFKKIKAKYEEFLSDHDNLYSDALNPRDAFFGGRAGNAVLVRSVKDNEKIRYIDVCSLYPYIQKYGKYPVGHPDVKIGHECDKYVGTKLEDVEGLVKCRVLPPRDLLYPVLPIHLNNTLMFPLCRKCCDDLVESNCTHDEKGDREITGTWVSDELKKAIDKGYEVTAIYEIWQYKTVQYNRETKSGGLFADYVNKFLQNKQEASGWPEEFDTSELREEYLTNFFEREGIRLDREKMKKNKGLRYIAKSCLNSLWGKFGQRNYPETRFCETENELIEVASDKRLALETVVPISETDLYYKYRDKKKDITPKVRMNVTIAVYTTAQARLKLYEYLDELQERVLYYDTDSCFYVTENDDQIVPTGQFLGDMTDELMEHGMGSYIREFVSLGPKRYSYIVVKPDKSEKIVTKISGVQLNSSNGDKFSHENIKKLAEGRIKEIEHTSEEIRRTRQHDVVTKPVTKRFKATQVRKRIFTRNDESYPYGYKRFRRSED
ncbi:hypothetical protein TSAR_009156 [Trichomalopsis sarcophagae]|uniref:DNA-directed DNA polymerase n=1 Tax=Trichomalopsis sarcophagae TaxID=543379 RepID=A0A232FE99_9HYME|nr:hypothetical protein TSAR_009156 [Trichomalopsis sarcophagae]